MKRINFQNAITKVNEDTFNAFQNNIEESTVIVSATEPTTGEKVWIQKGKNLLNLKYCNMYNFLNSNISNIQKNSITISSLGEWGYAQIDDVEVESGQTYTFSANYENSENSPESILIYNENNDELGHQDASGQTGKSEVTFTANTNKVKIRFSVNNSPEIRKNTLKYTNIQLEVGNVATSFEEYIANKIFYKDNDTWIKLMEEQPSNNIIRTQAVPSSSFGQIDVNEIIINNKMVEVNFRGYLTSEIVNNTPILSNIPTPEIGSSYTNTIYIGGQYDAQIVKWVYVASGELRGDLLPANTWVHVSLSYIQQ